MTDEERQAISADVARLLQRFEALETKARISMAYGLITFLADMIHRALVPSAKPFAFGDSSSREHVVVGLTYSIQVLERFRSTVCTALRRG